MSTGRTKETIALGSGKIYIKEYTTESIPDMATLISDMISDTYQLALIKGGAAVEYKKETYTASDDLGLVSKTITTSEDVTLTTGIGTWCGTTLATLCSTARVSDNPITGLRTVKIGGIENDDGKRYVILFVHTDEQDGNVYVAIVGKNTSGFKIDFKKEAETVIDAVFTAEACDREGTKLVYAEKIAKSGLLTLTSAAGATTGTTKITLTNTLGSGESYMYKTGASLDLPTYLGASTGYSAWDGTADITATTGNDVVIIVVNSADKVVKAGEVVAVSNAGE
jgi:hypothetical protein